jgi:hypothetical protein
MSVRASLTAAISLTAATLAPAGAADYSCDGLVVTGQKLVCSSFEPNWSLEFTCDGRTMQATFTDAFSGNSIQTTPGTATFSLQDPWTFTTSHGISGSIEHSPGICTAESGEPRDYQLTPTALPPGSPNVQMHPFCCEMQ